MVNIRRIFSLAVVWGIALLLPTITSAQTRTFKPAAPGQPPEVVTAPGQTIPDVATLKGLETIFFNVASVALGLAGIALFIMLIVGGFKYLTAGADRDKPQAARNALTYAFMGFIVVIAAFLILRFISEFTGVDVKIFKVTQ